MFWMPPIQNRILKWTDLNSVNLSDTGMTGVDLSYADVTGVDLSNVNDFIRLYKLEDL